MDAIHEHERAAIDRYKSYQRDNLPQVRTLEGLYAPDFDPSAYPGDRLDALERYICDLQKWTEVITTAADLRQEHYENFIAGKKPEDVGHRLWREGMLAIADDARRKLEHWTRARVAEWDEAADRSGNLTAETDSPFRRVNIATKNCDYTWENDRATARRPPKMSRDERLRLRREYREKLVSENREIDRAIAENENYHKMVADFSKYERGPAKKVSASDIRDQILLGGVRGLSEYIMRLQSYGNIAMVGTQDEFIEMSAALSAEAVAIQRDMCATYGCARESWSEKAGAGCAETIGGEVDGGKISTIFAGGNHTGENPIGENTTRKDTARKDITDTATPFETQQFPEFAGANVTICKHDCDHTKYQRGDGFTSKITALAEIYRMIAKSGNFIVVTHTLDELFYNREFNISGRVVILLLNALAGELSEDVFIEYMKVAADVILRTKAQLHAVSRADLPPARKSLHVAVACDICYRVQNLMNSFAMIYPMSRYFSAIQFMDAAMKTPNIACFAKIKIEGRLAIDPPVINYARIRKETGLKLVNPVEAVNKYREVRKNFDAAVKRELRRMKK